MEQQDFSAIPAELRERAQWVIWRLVERKDGKTGKIKLTKVPYQARYPEREAKSNGPHTWASFALAVNALQAGRADGIGYVFNKDHAGIDLDHCIDEQGQIAAWARAHIDSLASYTEYSPSGSGVHIICKAKLPGPGIHRGSVEMYDQGRFFTFTGKHLEDTTTSIENRQEEVTALYVAVTTKPERPQKAPPEQEQSTPLDVADSDLLALALRNSRFAALWNGNIAEYGNDASVADLALCCRLAFWTGKDKARIERLFRQSALLRDKWDEVHAGDGRTYGQMTTDKACEICTETYKPRRAEQRYHQRAGVAGPDQPIDNRQHAQEDHARAVEQAKERVVNLAERTMQDAGAPFEDEALEALRILKNSAPAEWARVHAELKKVGVNLRDLEHWVSQTEQSSGGNDQPYQETSSGLIWRRATSTGESYVPLTNFTARIVADVSEDDGAETRRRYEIQATLQQQCFPAFSVPADKFAAMNWPAEHLGAKAIVYPGNSTKDHARAAIQLLSAEHIRERNVYAHTGWRHLSSGWAYLHAAGAIGARGVVEGVEVVLHNRLGNYFLPAPPEDTALVTAIKASMQMLERLGPDSLIFPVYAAIWRAATEESNVNLHLVGESGGFKSELAGLAQAHWGGKMNGSNLPASWMSTGNAIEGLAFLAKDALLVVDDFCPTGSINDIQRLHATADRVLRGQANGAGRQRMRADSSLQADKKPRGLILSTGEDTPRGHSLRSRLLLLEVAPKDTPGGINADRLTTCQQDAKDGLYAQALAGFARWMATDYEGHCQRLRNEALKLRAQATQSSQHRRTPDIIAQLGAGLHIFLAYARESAAISAADAKRLWERGWKALGETATTQSGHQADQQPHIRFIKLLNAALASKSVHVAGLDGLVPEANAIAWGWRYEKNADEYRSTGKRIGWTDGTNLYLEPEAAYEAAQRMGQGTSDPLTITSRVLHKRLSEKGLLLSSEKTRQTHTIRKTLEGRLMAVLHFDAQIINAPDNPDNPPDKSQPLDKDTEDKPLSQVAAVLQRYAQEAQEGEQEQGLAEMAVLAEKNNRGVPEEAETYMSGFDNAPTYVSRFGPISPDKKTAKTANPAETIQRAFQVKPSMNNSASVSPEGAPASEGTAALQAEPTSVALQQEPPAPAEPINIEAKREEKRNSDPKLPALPKQAPLGIGPRIMALAEQIGYETTIPYYRKMLGGDQRAWQSFVDHCSEYRDLSYVERELKRRVAQGKQ